MLRASVAKVASHSTCPLPGVPRWFSGRVGNGRARLQHDPRGAPSSKRCGSSNVSYIIRQLGWSTSRASEAVSSVQTGRYISKRFRYSTAIVTSRGRLRAPRGPRGLSTERSRSSCVGGAPLRKPSGAASGPRIGWAQCRADIEGRPRAATPGSHLRIGADRAVVREPGAHTERREPELGETLPEALEEPSGLGVEDRDSTPSYPISRSSSKLASCSGPVTSGDQSIMFMPSFGCAPWSLVTETGWRRSTAMSFAHRSPASASSHPRPRSRCSHLTEILGGLGADVVKVEIRPAAEEDSRAWGPVVLRGRQRDVLRSEPLEALAPRARFKDEQGREGAASSSTAPTCSCSRCARGRPIGSGLAAMPCVRATSGSSTARSARSVDPGRSPTSRVTTHCMQGFAGLISVTGEGRPGVRVGASGHRPRDAGLGGARRFWLRCSERASNGRGRD